MTADGAGTGRYLFALTRGLAAPDVAGATAHAGAALEVVAVGDLQAVVCDVDLAEFGEEALRRNLEDLGWLESVARTHNEVVFRAAAQATVAPARLVTICEDDDSVRERVVSVHDAAVAALDRVEGCDEFAVKVYAVAGGAVPAGERPEHDRPDQPAGGAGPGASYLRRKKEQAQARRDSGERAAAAATSVEDGLAGSAVARRRLAPQDPRLTGRADPMVLNAAFLVARSEGPRFADLADDLARRHDDAVAVEVEGPWPPYSFATLE